MTYYCPNCTAIQEEERCENCGKKRLRPVQDNDPVYIANLDIFEAGILAEVLAEKGIPFFKQPVRGAVMKVQLGDWSDRFRIYVPFGAMLVAMDLAEELFGKNMPDGQS